MPARSSLAGNALAVPGFPPISISHPGPGGTSSGTTQYRYEGNTLKVTDPAGKWKKYETDVFGNLIKVIEPRPGGGADLETLYTYDIYNRLRTVTMTRSSGSQTRTFTYDGTTQRLLSVTNPENGTTYFTYNGDGTVATRRDAKQNRFEYSYDSKQRVTQVRRYPLAGPSGGTEDLCQRVDYSYDTNPYDGAYTQYGLGRPTAARWGGAGCAGGYTWTEMYSYTRAGRVTKKKLTPGSTFGTTGLESVQTYDNEGRMVTVKYPDTGSGGTVTGPTYAYAFDAVARPSGMTQNLTQAMVQSVVYNAASQITSMQYLEYTGGPTWLTETRQYNVRLQMTSQTVAPSSGGAALMDLRYNYSATQNNGRIGSMQDLVSGETVTYQYDELQRLISASTAGWGNSYTFDGFGNLLAKTVTGGLAPSLSINVDGNTNRITTGGYGYDLNGNLTTLPGVTGIAYDADNRLLTANGEQYRYAPSNQRVWLRKSNGVEHFMFYGVDGARLGVYTGGPYFSLLKQEVHFAGKRIRSGGLAVAEDRLGSARLDGTTASRFYPYGEEFVPTTANDRQKFGTYYRDAGTGLDYANQRYYSASIGRFLTADPYQASGGPADPGSWNRYAYVGGDPMNWRDPRGLQRCPPGYLPIGDECMGDATPSPAPGGPQPNPQDPEPLAPKMWMVIDHPGISAVKSGLQYIANRGFKKTGKCRDLFEQLLANSEGSVDVGGLIDQIAATAAGATHHVYDGPSSKEVLDPDKFPDTASPGATTVGQWFAADRSREALSQFNGSAIWVRQDSWNGWIQPYADGGTATQYGLGTLMHELLHKSSIGGGFNHDQLNDALRAIGVTNLTVGRNGISDRIGRICF